MDTKRKKPIIRFKGFNDDWEQRKLGEIGSVSMCRRIFKEQTSDSGEIPFYKIGTFGGQADAYISEELFEDYKLKYPYPKIGDVLISASGSIGRTVEFTGESAYFQDSNIVWLNHDECIDNTFLKCFYNVVKWSGLEGSTIKRLYNDNILKTEISIPSIDEQHKIGAYFEKLDHLITLHQCKYDNLTKVKKTMLEKMFPKKGANVPEIRFKGFTEAWEQCKLSSKIIDIADGPFGSNLKKEHYTEEKEARIVQLSNLSDEGWQEENTRYTTFEHAREIQRCIVNKGEMVMGKMMPAGMTIMRPDTEKMYVLSSDCIRIKLDENNITNVFFLYETKSVPFLDQVNNDSQGSTRVRTSISKIRDMNIMVPILEEQQKLSDYFLKLDHLITLHRKQLEKLKYMKQAMLNKMFV